MKVLNFDDDDDDDERKKSKKPTLAQTIDQVMTIKTHTESSKTELSSGGKRPFRLWRFFFKINCFPPIEGIFFHAIPLGAFVSPTLWKERPI